MTLILGGDLAVRRPGFGALHLTGPGSWGEPADHEGAKTLLRRALGLGVNFIDTADSYGPEVSERLVAEALFPYAEDLVIATKGGLLRTGPSTEMWPVDGRPEHLRVACEGSLRRLRLDRIDLYQLHAVDPAVPIEESIGALAELQAEGKIRHIGVSNVTVGELSRARTVSRIVSVQNRYSLAQRASEDVLATCDRENLAFLPWQPLALGALASQKGKVARIAAAHDATPAQIALAWLLHRSPMILPIPGTTSTRHLEENVAAASLSLTNEESAQLLDALGPGEHDD
jgi:aryl-alcohol dehydrogenase-like predicted oxidoreductase